MKLRPHHLLCIQFFSGHGYDAEFSQHMYRLIENLSDDTECCISEGCDEICQKCPNRDNDMCEKNDKVCRMDARVLTVCGFAYDDMAQWKNLASAVKDKIFDMEWFEEICGECEWYCLCREIKEEKWKWKET